MKSSFSVGDKYGDSRDVNKIVDELEDEVSDVQEKIDELKEEISDLETKYDDDDDVSPEDWAENLEDISQSKSYLDTKEAELSDLKDELEKWKNFVDEFEGYVDDWQYGATLIHEDYFTDYIKNNVIPDLFSDMKDLPNWLEGNINWEGVAEDFQQDYTSGEIEGVTYWCR